MDWCLKYADQDDPVPALPLPADSSVYLIRVVDLFNPFITSALVRQGLMPSAPLSPSVCITINALELYQVAHLWSPHLSIQAWVKTLCNMHGVQFHSYLSRQFSIAFDLYLSICHTTDKIVQTSLNHGMPGCSSEHTDSRKVHDDLYLTREEVDKWAHKPLQDLMHNDDITKCMWAIFDETGVFLALCRHGFSLVIADMVQSGGKAKYPLAVVAKLLQVFGKDLGGGFDIGCQFKTTLAWSPLGPQAKELNYTSLVGGFHGHAHRRLCHLVHLATYTKGLGLEDLEGCERAFSKSNDLTPAVRYASAFHHMQAITTYFKYNDDMEVYQNLTTFLYNNNNYKQALDVINSGPTALSQAMQDLQISNFNVFEEWREEEKIYLEGLSKEPIVETLEMEYYQKLINVRKDLKIVQDFENKLVVAKHSEPGSAEWVNTSKLVAMRMYQQALDQLEGLIVARLFELTKLNMSQTDQYNTAAKGLPIFRHQLEWKEVVEYSFLADFDLLCDARQDISHKLWATPAGRLAMDLYFKIQHACEEINRLNIEKNTRLLDPQIAHQIWLHSMVHGHFTSYHKCRLCDIASLAGFSGSIVPGTSI
ncbi:hypothetical protein BU17DRAFT_74962 [Hysterangium stoloniferum]|nr:hypothetical protein BU17DRAFT_74962 [Hysterangium stoloniferum]